MRRGCDYFIYYYYYYYYYIFLVAAVVLVMNFYFLSILDKILVVSENEIPAKNHVN